VTQLIEIWETFLLQMDAEDEGQIKGLQSAPSESAAPASAPTAPPAAGQPGDAAEGAPATATDVALEQDA
jgi:hypothetical protein